MIDKDLTEAGVSVVNVGNTAFLRYSRIFLRKENPVMGIPVAIITDVDVREYEASEIVDGTGKKTHQYTKKNLQEVSEASTEKIEKLKKDFDDAGVKVFVAPQWTLEYSIFKSKSLSEKFQTVFKQVHSQVDDGDIERDLASKLINKGLEKTEIAYQLAQIIEVDPEIYFEQNDNEQNDDAIKYLMDAIKYACAN